jgi:hypothetical protein
MAQKPTPQQARDAGRDCAVEIVLAILVAELALQSSGTGEFPDRIQATVDTAASSILPAIRKRFRDQKLVKAVDAGYVGTADEILEVARGILAKWHQSRRDESPGE